MKTGRRTIWHLLIAFCLLSACDSDESTSTSEAYEKAFYMAYATTCSSEYMHAITVSDIVDLINELEIIAADVYTANSNALPASINLSTAASDYGVSVPSGMNGTITKTSSLGVDIDIALNNCVLDSDTGRTYSGSFTGDCECTVTSNVLTIIYTTLYASSMTITYSGKDYGNAVFTGFTLDYDSSGTYPAYTLTGRVTIDDTAYYFEDFCFEKTSSSYLSVSGVVSFDDYYIGLDCDSMRVSASTGLWTSGAVTLISQESDGTIYETATATLSGTTVTIEDDDSSWDWENWSSERLVP